MRSIHTETDTLSRFILLACFAVFNIALQASAQDSTPDESSVNSRVTISKETFNPFNNEIPSEILSLIDSGLMEFTADRDLPVEIQTKFDVTELLTKCSEIFTEWSEYKESFVLLKLQDNGPKWRVGGEFARFHPYKLEDKKNSDQLFREKIVIKSPPKLSGYSYLTFRFISPSEDLLWVYSPFIQRDRQILPSLRSDPIFFSDLAPDDLFAWSGKPQEVDARIEDSSNLMVPIRRIDTVADLGCAESTLSKPLEPVKWNFQKNNLAQRAGWLPVNFSFSLRPTTTINLVSKDPYSSYSRQTLLVDLLTGLPVIKVVYGKDGKPWKIVLALYDLAKDSREGMAKIHRATISYDATQNSATIWESAAQRGCKASESADSIKGFDPTYLGKTAEP